MEALFEDFDYALKDSKGNQYVISRNKASAFLTKHLRAYGGKGVYKEYKIGRLLRNLVFSGKGLVENPANPESLILNETLAFHSKANIVSPELLGYTSGSSNPLENKMNELESLNKKLLEVQAALAAETKAKEELEKRLTDEANKAAQAKIDDAVSKAAESEKALASLKEVLKAKEVEFENLNKTLEATKASLDEASLKLKNIELEKTALARKTELVTKLNVDEATADKLVKTLSVLSDEAFAAYVEASPKTNKQEVTPAPVAPSKKEEVVNPVEAASAALNNAEPNSSTGSPVSDNSDVEEVRKRIAENYKACRASTGSVRKNTEPEKK
jgi:DNA repair exonuclease SbcCD ATPase subunit